MGDVYRAVSDPTRRAIIDELVARDDQTLFELCGRLAMNHGLTPTRQAISQHLAVLEDAGLVRTRRDGRYKFHSVDLAPLVDEIESRWLRSARKDPAPCASTSAASSSTTRPRPRRSTPTSSAS